MPTREGLAEIRERHQECRDRRAEHPQCCQKDAALWPCDVAILLSTIEKLEKVAEAAREVLGDDKAQYLYEDMDRVEYRAVTEAALGKLRSALSALEGKRE